MQCLTYEDVPRAALDRPWLIEDGRTWSEALAISVVRGVQGATEVREGIEQAADNFPVFLFGIGDGVITMG
jgi:hypothetical protein